MNLRIVLLLFGLASLQACSPAEAPEASTAYQIHGTVQNPDEEGHVILATFDPVSQVKTPLDTAEISETGEYTLRFEWTQPDLFRVAFGNQNVMLAIDEGQNDITLHVEGAKNGTVEIIGSPDSEKLQGYEAFRQESNTRLIKPPYDRMRAATKAGDTQTEIDAVLAYSQNSKEHRRELIEYTEKNIGTSIALYGTVLRWTGDDQVDKLDALVNAFATAHPDLAMTKVMQEKLNRYRQVAVGVKAPEIKQPNQNGEMVSLYENKGTYTLIDFWASWCGPCLLQVPDLKEAQAAYGEKGFQIFSVSADTKEKKWKDAIVEYDLDWPNVSDLEGWNSEAAKAYNVTFLPFNLLIDSEGTIIDKNLHSKALQSKLAELLGE